MENKISNKTLTLKSKSGKFIGKDGKERSFTSYFVEIMGVEVKVDAYDNTGKQLLTNYFKNDARDI